MNQWESVCKPPAAKCSDWFNTFFPFCWKRNWAHPSRVQSKANTSAWLMFLLAFMKPIMEVYRRVPVTFWDNKSVSGPETSGYSATKTAHTFSTRVCSLSCERNHVCFSVLNFRSLFFTLLCFVQKRVLCSTKRLHWTKSSLQKRQFFFPTLFLVCLWHSMESQFQLSLTSLWKFEMWPFKPWVFVNQDKSVLLNNKGVWQRLGCAAMLKPHDRNDWNISLIIRFGIKLHNRVVLTGCARLAQAGDPICDNGDHDNDSNDRKTTRAVLKQNQGQHWTHFYVKGSLPACQSFSHSCTVSRVSVVG